MATPKVSPRASARVWRNMITMNRLKRESKQHNTSGRCPACGDGWGGDGVCPDCNPRERFEGGGFGKELRRR